jgi:DNA-binding MarR family transcriptional regulator
MEWMGKYHDLNELVIRVLNEYSVLQNKQLDIKGQSISFSEAQVIEEILMNEESNMTTFAKELGVTKAAITKTMKKLESKKYITRYKRKDNKKEVFVSLTALGKKTYENYQKYIYKNLFGELYGLMDTYSEKEIAMLYTLFGSLEKSFKGIAGQ